MELVWEDPPVPDAPFFTKDVYDQYSLAPSSRELWASLQSPADTGRTQLECGAQSGQKSTTKEVARLHDSKDDSGCDTVDVDTAVEAPEGCQNPPKAYVADHGFPQPRLPFPCVSGLASNEQRAYLNFLCSKKLRVPPQHLKARVDQEVMQFQRYLQDVAKVCAGDYSFISQGALQYAEDYLRARLECIQTLPQLYQICEMTSLTGGTFNPALSLTLEKQLVVTVISFHRGLIQTLLEPAGIMRFLRCGFNFNSNRLNCKKMFLLCWFIFFISVFGAFLSPQGSVDITSCAIMAADAQLATDYQSVSSENPPAKKAKDMHAAISSDNNAEKLCERYEPHVCLTREALVTLLDNHGPDFAQRWELPVCIKVNRGKGVTPKKTVYIESPLLDNEITVRQKSLIYHEESLKLCFTKKGKRNVCHLMTELPVDDREPSLEGSQRNMIPLASDDLDFGVDLTDLETFGEAPNAKVQKTQNEPLKHVQSTSSPLSNKEKRLTNPLSRNSQEEMGASVTDIKHYVATEQTSPTVVREANEATATKPAYESDKESDQDFEDDRLIIDYSTSPSQAATPTPASVPVASASPSPERGTARRQASKRAKAPADQLGEILRMQTAMFSAASDAATKSPASSQETVSPTRCVEPPRHTLPLSLVKPCVTSYLERNRQQGGETSAAPPVIHTDSPEKKKILSQELQAGAEDEQDYESPERGNLLYKLFSLQDVLLIVRTSVPVAQSRKIFPNPSHVVPVHVLPKLEYQLCHGVECLSNSEACQLWTERALHSSTVSFVAHINPHTSKVALLRRLPDAWRDNISCGFKPVKSLNILHHLLKKLTKMDKGRYLITHKPEEPFVTLLKAADGKACRSAYDLCQVHNGLPRTPTNGPVPWMPLDPTVALPFHKKHGRVPCTFPPRSTPQASVDGNAAKAGKPGGKKKKKKKNRSANHNKYT